MSPKPSEYPPSINDLISPMTHAANPAYESHSILLAEYSQDKVRRISRLLRTTSNAHNLATAFRLPPEEMLAPRRRMIDEGSISKIEEWAISLASTYPEHSLLAERIMNAALHIDFAELKKLAEGMPSRHAPTSS